MSDIASGRRSGSKQIVGVPARQMPVAFHEGDYRDFLCRHKRAAREAARDTRQQRHDFAACLLDRVADPRNLMCAIDSIVSGGEKAPGPNRLRLEDLSRQEKWELARSLSKAITSGTYRPGPVRRKQIRKTSGKGDRTIEISNVEDKIVQVAILQVLQPLIDPHFDDRSFGYRPGLGRDHAHVEASMLIDGSSVVIVEDLRNAFTQVQKLELTHEESYAPINAIETTLGWIDQRGVCYQHEDVHEVLTRVASLAREQAFEELPPLEELRGVWERAHTRYTHLRRVTLLSRRRIASGSARRHRVSAKTGRGGGASRVDALLPVLRAARPNVTLFTDGSCRGPRGVGGWAFILEGPGDSERRIQADSHPRTTANRMELTAVVRGLETVEQPSVVTVVTDSQYVVQNATERLPVWRENDWAGGPEPDDVNVILGPNGSGKTALGVQILVSGARHALRSDADEADKVKLQVHVGCGADRRFLQQLAAANAARVKRHRFSEIGCDADLSTTANPLDYDHEVTRDFDHGNGRVLGETERLEATRPWMKRLLQFVDVERQLARSSGNSGHAWVHRIRDAIDGLRSEHDRDIGQVIIDSAWDMISTQRRTHVEDGYEAQKRELAKFISLVRQHIAEPLGCVVWVIHPLVPRSSTLSPHTLPRDEFAHWCPTFVRLASHAFVLGNRDPSSGTQRLHYTMTPEAVVARRRSASSTTTSPSLCPPTTSTVSTRSGSGSCGGLNGYVGPHERGARACNVSRSRMTRASKW